MSSKQINQNTKMHLICRTTLLQITIWGILRFAGNANWGWCVRRAQHHSELPCNFSCQSETPWIDSLHLHFTNFRFWKLKGSTTKKSTLTMQWVVSIWINKFKSCQGRQPAIYPQYFLQTPKVSPANPLPLHRPWYCPTIYFRNLQVRSLHQLHQCCQGVQVL